MSQRDERGSFLPLFALLIVGLLIMAAIAVDGGHAREQRRDAQAAADAGALGGAKALDSGSTSPGGCTDVRCVGAYYTFQSASVTVGTMPASTSCDVTVGTNQTCSKYVLGTGTAQKTVEVTAPYSFNGVPCTATANPCAQYVHVKTKWSSVNAFGGVANIKLFAISGSATAQNTGQGSGSAAGSTPPTTDCAGEDNFAKADGTPDLIGPAQPHFGDTVGAHFHGFDSALDANSIVMQITYADQTGSHTINVGPGDGTTGYKVTVKGGVDNWDIQYKLPNTPVLAKTDASGSRIVYTLSLHAADVDQNPGQDCGNASFLFTWDGHGIPTGASACGENSFLNGGLFPINGSSVQPGTAAGAHYSDESAIQSHDVTESGYSVVGIDFELAGPGFTDASGNAYQIPKSATPGVLSSTDGYTLTNDPTGRDHFNTLINWFLPPKTDPRWVNGAQYTLSLKAYDTDNNKPGNDCGQGSWTFTIQGATGKIRLVE